MMVGRDVNKDADRPNDPSKKGQAFHKRCTNIVLVTHCSGSNLCSSMETMVSTRFPPERFSFRQSFDPPGKNNDPRKKKKKKLKKTKIKMRGSSVHTVPEIELIFVHNW